MQENEELEKNHIIIVPSYLSKGLEFDAVIIFTLDEIYSLEEIELKLLYVAMTRPMHRLYLFSREMKHVLLHNADPKNFILTTSNMED